MTFIDDIKPGAVYEMSDNVIFMVISVLRRSHGEVKFTELRLTGNFPGLIQEATFNGDIEDRLGVTLLTEGM